MIVDTSSPLAHAHCDAPPDEPLTNKPRPTVRLLKSAQKKPGERPCFRSEARLSCSEWDCDLREDCCRLVAEWRR
jgi:hypothetical protein